MKQMCVRDSCEWYEIVIVIIISHRYISEQRFFPHKRVGVEVRVRLQLDIPCPNRKTVDENEQQKDNMFESAILHFCGICGVLGVRM